LSKRSTIHERSAIVPKAVYTSEMTHLQPRVEVEQPKQEKEDSESDGLEFEGDANIGSIKDLIGKKQTFGEKFGQSAIQPVIQMDRRRKFAE